MNPAEMRSDRRYLNLGCGDRFRPTWTNVDIASFGEGVIAHDLFEPLPFPEGSFDCVYHSHVLEHLDASAAKRLLRECYRVLKLGGVLRIAVPDLEGIARSYIACLDACLAKGDRCLEENYDWIVMELFDQMVRSNSGGAMFGFLRNEKLGDLGFVMGRMGGEAKRILERHQHRSETEAPRTLPRVPASLPRVLAAIRERILKFVFRDDWEALRLGRFRRSGEIHQWMYDRFSLARLFAQTGFVEVCQRDAKTSFIAGWQTFGLDTEPDGSVYKPDSLFMEGIKPSP